MMDYSNCLILNDQGLYMCVDNLKQSYCARCNELLFLNNHPPSPPPHLIIRELDSRSRSCGRHCLVSLSKTLYPLLSSTVLTKEEPSRFDLRFIGWDIYLFQRLLISQSIWTQIRPLPGSSLVRVHSVDSLIRSSLHLF